MAAPIGEVFARIDPTPLGSASLAQVHRATLVTGEDVAVKVQRPGVREIMALDVSIMRSIARAATKMLPSAQVVDLGGVVEELWDTFESETDFLVEARNLSEFKRFCEAYRYMDCPKPYMDLCTEHVVVMDYVEGIAVSHTDQLIEAGYDLKEIGTKLVDNYATQVLDDGFFHADPHPGNIIISGGQIVLIDLGMTGRLNSQARSVLREMIFAVAKQDSAALADGLLRFAGTESDPEDYPALLADLDMVVKEFGTVDLGDLDIAAFLTSLTSLAQRHGIEVPGTVTTVGRALVTLEGLLDEFIPDVNMIQIISDHIAGSKSLDRAAKDEIKALGVEGHQALHGLLSAASESRVAMRMLTRGQLRMNMEVVGSEEPMRLLSDMVNRLTMALIVVGLFVGSSIVYYAGMKPIIFGIPVVGFMGYVIAFILSASRDADQSAGSTRRNDLRPTVRSVFRPGSFTGRSVFQEQLRCLHEVVGAVFPAEVIGRAVVLARDGVVVDGDGHAAHRVGRGLRRVVHVCGMHVVHVHGLLLVRLMVMALIGVMAIGTGTVSGVENDVARAVLVGRSPVGVSSACGGEGDGVGAQCDAPHAVRVQHQADGAERHRQACDHRAEQPAGEGVQHAGGDGDADDVVAEGPGEILPDVAHRGLG